MAVAAAALPSQGLAASGSTRLKLEGPAAGALLRQGVRVVPLEPAAGSDRRVSLPLAAGLAGSETTLLRHRGGIELESADGKATRLTRISLLLGNRAKVEARLGGEEIDLFEVLRGGRRDVDAATGKVRLEGLRLKLTRGAARAIAHRLELRTLPSKLFATLSSSLSGLARGGGVRGAEGPPADGPEQKSAACPLPSGPGPAAEGTPPLATRPAGAVDVSSATIDWHVRESFIRYIASGEGTSVSDGATADPPVLLPDSSVPLSYDFHFPFAGGWLDTGADPANPADDAAALYFSGALRFLYGAHGIDLVTASPEIELAGGASRAIFSIAESGGAPQRQVLVNLDLSRAAAISVSGNFHTYAGVPGAIPAGTASSVFAGFYPPGTEFGCFTLTFASS